ncbi:MAG: hypothetical protein QNK37_24370 [Acidobacteriota bacterium]|nr:hypothetical protein [Acidobacteriota bacterium]
MAKPLDFVRLGSSFKGLMTRAVNEFDRYMEDEAGNYRWVFVENPERIARALEILAEDLPEESLARVVPKMPYLFLLFRDHDMEPVIPVEATLAFLSIISQSGMITIMRQCSDREQLAASFDLDPAHWDPMVFMVAGIPNLNEAHEEDAPEHCHFF